MPTDDEFEALLAQLYGYGITPEQLASLPMVPNTYIDSKWNQDAGTYVPTEMQYGKPSTRLWHAQTALQEMGLPLPILGEAMGLPTIDVGQPFNPELTDQPVLPGEEDPASYPFLEALESSQDADEQAIAKGIRDGVGLSTIKGQIALVEDENKRDALNKQADRAYEEFVTGGDVGASHNSSGGSAPTPESGGDYRSDELGPVQKMYAEAGLPMPWEQYTGETVPDQYLPKNYQKNIARAEKKGNRFLKSIERFVQQTKKRQDESLTREERDATGEAVKSALKGLGIMGNAAPGAPPGWQSSNQELGQSFLGQVADPGTLPSAFDEWHDNMQGSVGDLQRAQVYDNPFADAIRQFTSGGAMTPDQNQLIYEGTGYNNAFAGGSPEAHMQIAREGAQFAAEEHDRQVRDAAAKIASAQGRSPSSDAVSARVALARFLGIPI